MIGGGQSDAKVNASVDAFASALNASVHKEKLFRYGASLHVVLVPDVVDSCSSESFREMLDTANGAARRLKQLRLGTTTTYKWSVYVGVHLRFTATDDRILDITMLPHDFGECMQAIV